MEQWSAAFLALEGEELASLLARIEAKEPQRYRDLSLSYLHARALIDAGESDEAIAKLTPYLTEGHPFRPLALYHRSTLAEGEVASRLRRELLTKYPDAVYREEAIDEELTYLAELDDPARLVAFADAIEESASTERRREISARIVEALVDEQPDEAFKRALAILSGGTTDDAADRAARAIDREPLVARLSPAQLAMLGQTMQTHRHYERAVALLQAALRHAYSDELQYALGRSYFGDEKYEEAQAAYLRGAQATKDASQKATFLWHAARAAQLRGDDATAENLMTRTIAVKGNFPSTKAALTQRLRTRIKQARIQEASSDLALIRRIAGNERTVLDGALAYAVGILGRGNAAAARSVLASIPAALTNDYDEAEIAYWTARS